MALFAQPNLSEKVDFLVPDGLEELRKHYLRLRFCLPLDPRRARRFDQGRKRLLPRFRFQVLAVNDEPSGVPGRHLRVLLTVTR